MDHAELNEQLVEQLKRIANALEKMNEREVALNHNSSVQHLVNVAEELAPFEPELARLILHYAE